MIIITETILPGAIIIIVIFPGVMTVMVKYFLDTYIENDTLSIYYADCSTAIWL